MSFPPSLLRLPQPDDLAAQIRAALPLRADVRWYTQTGSTNADVQTRLRARDLPVGTEVVVQGAHSQQAGRGRAGRAFQTDPGAALLVSAGFRMLLPVAILPALSVAAGLAARQALAPFLPQPDELKVKWPNDLLWQDAKLAGILIESGLNGAVQGGYADTSVVVGMGTNLRGAPEMSQTLGRPIADWSQTGGGGNACALVCALVLAWHAMLDELAQEGFARMAARFDAVDALAGRAVRVLDGNQVQDEGVACGVDDAGRLRLRTAQGERLVMVGDVSVRSQSGSQP